MKVLVCGSRTWTDGKAIHQALRKLLADHPASQVTVIHGGAKGADSLAHDAATWLGVETHVFPADWLEHGKAAGPIRNRQMLDQQPDLVLAFSSGSRGTQDTIDEARRRGIRVLVTGSEVAR